MKLALLTLPLLVVLAFTIATEDMVFDAEGEPVRPGAAYYVLPYIWAQGGGLRLAKLGNSTCPVDIIQDFSEVSRGQPINIYPSIAANFVITDSPISLRFLKTSDCAGEDAEWILPLKSTTDPNPTFVSIGRSESSVPSFFIKQHRSGPLVVYGFAYRPGLSAFESDLDVGIYDDDEERVRRLAATASLDASEPIWPFHVVFVKAKDERSSAI